MDLKHIGKKVKQVRLRQKKTQQQIADICHISKSLLSKIENGQTSSAVATLSRISDALGVPLSWILEDHLETDIVLLPKDKRHYKIGDEHMGYSYELLANRSKFSNIEPTIVHVTPKNVNLRQDPYTHTQEEFIYILAGSIYLHYDGKDTPMDQGDTAYFRGTKPHLFVPVDNQGAKVLTVFVHSDDE